MTVDEALMFGERFLQYPDADANLADVIEVLINEVKRLQKVVGAYEITINYLDKSLSANYNPRSDGV